MVRGRIFTTWGRNHFLPRSEEVADHAHAGHHWAFDDQQGTAELDAGFFGVDLDVGVDSLYECVREPLFDGAVAPFFSLLFADGCACAFEMAANSFYLTGAPRSGVGTAVEQDVFNEQL